MAGLTNIQNEFLKMRLANNPEFKAEYFPNVITRPPVGPLYNVDVLKGNPTSNVYFEESNYEPPLSYKEMVKAPEDTLESPGRMEWERTKDKPVKGAEFRDIPVPYDYPGSRVNIQTTERYGPFRGEPVQDVGHIRTGEGIEYYKDTGLPRNVTEEQTSAAYMRPDMIADYGTAPKAPRNEMVPTPDWYAQLYETDQPHVDQADINATVEGILSHEVGHGTTLGLEPFKSKTEPFRNVKGEDVYERGIDSPFLMSKEASDVVKNMRGYEVHTAPHLYNQNELYNRVLDLERLKMTYPKNYKTHPMWKTYQARALDMFNDSISMGKYKNVPKRFRPKYETYYKHIKPSIQNYLKSIDAGISPVNVQKQAASMPQNLSFNTGAGNKMGKGDGGYQPTTRAQNVARTSSRVGPGGNVKAYGLAHGGMIDVPLQGRRRDI